MHFKESVTACAKDICAIERLVEGRRGIKWWNEEIMKIIQKNKKVYEYFL